jgi:hypothetical protein
MGGRLKTIFKMEYCEARDYFWTPISEFLELLGMDSLCRTG